MGRKFRRRRKPVLLYPALCLALVITGCSFTAKETGVHTHIKNGDYLFAHDSLIISDAHAPETLSGYILLYTDKNSPYYSPEKAYEKISELLKNHPESEYAVYAANIKNLLKGLECYQGLNTEMTETLERSAGVLADKNTENAELEAHLNEFKTLNEKINAENRELSRRIKALKTENQIIKKQLELMKEVDLKAEKHIIR